VLSFRDRYLNEGRHEGREEGRKEGKYNAVTEIEELLKSGLSLEDALQKIRQETSLQSNNLAAKNN